MEMLLSHFSHVWLCATPQMAAHQASPSLGFSRQEHWSGLPFPSPMQESEKWKWSHSVVWLRVTLSNPMDCSLPGSSIHGIFQARVLEWGAIAFSVYGNKNMQIRKWKIGACNEIVRRPPTAPRGLMAPLLSNLHDAATSQCCLSQGLILSLIT